MLTTDAHFKAAQSLLNKTFPGVRVNRLFIARRVPETIDVEDIFGNLDEQGRGQHDGFRYSTEACDPERNIWRSYCITGGQNLFGDWIVAMNYGLIGSRGTTKTVALADEEAMRRYVRAMP